MRMIQVIAVSAASTIVFVAIIGLYGSIAYALVDYAEDNKERRERDQAICLQLADEGAIPPNEVKIDRTVIGWNVTATIGAVTRTCRIYDEDHNWTGPDVTS